MTRPNGHSGNGNVGIVEEAEGNEILNSMNRTLYESGSAAISAKPGDEEVSRLAVNQQIVVTVPAGEPVYVVLQQTPKSSQPVTSG
jgi:hypothetical protein